MKKDTLGLYGPKDSKYLRLVERRAEEAGIKTAWVAGPTPGCVAYVADTEAGWPLWDLSDTEDVDRLQHQGLSCCAEAVLRYIDPLSWGPTLMIGRGHAVQGLDETLDGVTVCSSTALDMAYRAGRVDIIVNSASEVSSEVIDAVPLDTVVIDISGSMVELAGRVAVYVSRAEIGAANIGLLLERVRNVMMEVEHRIV